VRAFIAGPLSSANSYCTDPFIGKIPSERQAFPAGQSEESVLRDLEYQNAPPRSGWLAFKTTAQVRTELAVGRNPGWLITAKAS
jgi:hypothetical protein